MRLKNHSKNGRGLIVSLLKGTFICIILYPLVALVAGVICYNTKDPTSYTGLFSLCSFIISGALASFINVKLNGSEGIGSALLCSVFALLVYFAARIILNSGVFSLFSVFNGIIYFTASLLFALLGNRKPKSRKRKLRF